MPCGQLDRQWTATAAIRRPLSLSGGGAYFSLRRKRNESTACAKQFRTFADLAERLNMDVSDLMRQGNGKVSQRNWTSTKHS